MKAEELWRKWAPLIEIDRPVYTWTSDRELAWLAEQASKAHAICEIGSYHGRSALVMARASSPYCKILCIDKFVDDGVEDVCRRNLKGFIDIGKVAVFAGTSRCFEEATPPLYDFAFIDGGHLFEDVKCDIEKLLPVMKPGSVLSGHDWRPDLTDGVNRGVLAHFSIKRINVFESIWSIQL